MTIFDHPIWPHVLPYAHMTEGRDNVDLLGMPDQVRDLALRVVVNCCACFAVIHPFRARALSGRSRVAGTPVERRLFYAGTCASERDDGCARTKAARQHKLQVRAVIEAYRAA